MYEMTLQGLLRLGESYFAQENAEWLIVELDIGNTEPEIIINPKENFKAKLKYYAEAYNDDLTLKENPNIRITSYDVVEHLEDYFAI